MVSVLATAHMHPASTAHTIRCGAWRTSLRTCEVPRMKAGTLQRARKTPNTMMRETVMGEMSGLTNFIGASAPPSQAPAAKPQKMPRACRLRRRVACMRGGIVDGGAPKATVRSAMSAESVQKEDAASEGSERNPEVEVGSDRAKQVSGSGLGWG